MPLRGYASSIASRRRSALRRQASVRAVRHFAASWLLLLVAALAHADPDLPNPSANIEVIPAGSLIIAMDGKQTADGWGAYLDLGPVDLLFLGAALAGDLITASKFLR